MAMDPDPDPLEILPIVCIVGLLWFRDLCIANLPM